MHRSDTVVAKRKMDHLSQIIPKEYEPTNMKKLLKKPRKAMSEREKKRVKELE